MNIKTSISSVRWVILTSLFGVEVDVPIALAPSLHSPRGPQAVICVTGETLSQWMLGFCLVPRVWVATSDRWSQLWSSRPLRFPVCMRTALAVQSTQRVVLAYVQYIDQFMSFGFCKCCTF